MLILVDENIPFARETFASIGEVSLFSGTDLRSGDLNGAGVLLVRSVTQVDESLLGESRIRFVGSATIGTDHVDLDFLKRSHIAFAHAPGSNADSVVEYVIAALLRLCVRERHGLQGRCVGIIGCGQIGARLARRLSNLGADVLVNDPPLAGGLELQGHAHPFKQLDEVLSEADAITVHVPLERRGSHPTFHLIGHEEIRRMRPGSWLINTSRGAVVDNDALKRDLSGAGRLGRAVLDVWEGEPQADVELVRRVDIATPHIAGYAYDAKLRGTWILYRALRAFLGMEDPGEMPDGLAGLPAAIPVGAPDPNLSGAEWLDLLIRGIYDIERDDDAMRRHARSGTLDARRFTALRRDYPVRREFGAYSLPVDAVPPDRRGTVENGLGIRMR